MVIRIGERLAKFGDRGYCLGDLTEDELADEYLWCESATALADQTARDLRFLAAYQRGIESEIKSRDERFNRG